MEATRATPNRARAAGAAVAVALVGAVVIASFASAHNRVYSNSVKLNRAVDYGKYSGRVKSANKRCKRNREVQVYRAKAGADPRLGTTFTDASGSWTLVAGPPLGNGRKVYALIETKVLASNAQHDHTCAVDRSPVRTIPYP